MKDLVSVVVPVYNVEKFLDRCVKSIVEQTYGILEIILVDDGSKDISAEICDKWAQKDVRITVIHKDNAGAGFARNSGIDSANGKYILFVDSDDYIAPQTVEKCVAELEKTKADFVMFGRFNVDGEGNITEMPMVDSQLFFEGDQVMNDILPGLFTYERGSGISTCCKMYDLELIKSTGIRYRSEREILSEDAFFNLELFRYIKTVAIIPESFYYYYKNENSLSRSYRKDLPELNAAFLKAGLALCEESDYPKRVCDYIKARYHIYAFGGMKQIEAGDFSAKEKKKLLYGIFKSKTMQSSINSDVLRLASFPLKVFYTCVRLKLYSICHILIRLSL